MFKKISDGFYFFKGIDRDSNSILIRDKDRALIIDLGTGNNISNLLSALKELNIEPQRAQYYFTHSHCDHIGAYSYIFRRYGSKIISYIHKAEFDLINNKHYEHMYCPFYGIDFDGTRISNSVIDGDEIFVGDIVLNIIHTPGHTIGSTVLYVPKQKILISGDTIFSEGSVGRWDFITGNKEMLKQSILKLQKLDVQIILPGHMSPAMSNGNKIIENAYNRFFT